MSALVSNSPAEREAAMPAREKTEAWPFGGFGPGADDASSSSQLGGTALTVLLVLYPALASVAVVLAAFMLSGTGSV